MHYVKRADKWRSCSDRRPEDFVGGASVVNLELVQTDLPKPTSSPICRHTNPENIVSTHSLLLKALPSQ
jgi:hypothetical protein